jgi:hypothetical protein
LEDAWVQELSKNGFNVILDTELMNNTGTAKELAERVLVDTDWQVESDDIVERVEESLAYLTVKQDFLAHRIIEDNGKIDITNNTTLIEANSIILGFYSSCRGKPHRF